MSGPISFTAPGRPKAWQRAGRAGKRSFTPRAVTDRKKAVADAARKAMDGQARITGPVDMSCRFVFAIPKSWSKAKKEDAINGLVLHTSRPDRDNLEKLIMDALNGVCWDDDCQVAIWQGSKVYGPEDCTEVIIRPTFAGGTP